MQRKPVLRKSKGSARIWGFGAPQGRPSYNSERIRKTLRRHWFRLGHNRRCVAACLLALVAISVLPFFLSYDYYQSIMNEAIPTLQLPADAPRYTVVLISHPGRLRTLSTVLTHYSRCPSLKEIVVVWADASPPSLAQLDLPLNLPVRFRGEVYDSLSNRFKPDPLITTEAVLSVDDDTLLFCSDLEAGFVEWQAQPERLTGFSPRLIEGANEMRYLSEKQTYRRGEYNIMLTVAMFYRASLMKDYWRMQDEFATFGRGVVDRLFNCEDILMNYVAAAAAVKLQGGGGILTTPVAKYVRPRRRMDLWMMTNVGISRNSAAHQAKREHCSTEFARFIRRKGLPAGVGAELPREEIRWSEQRGGRPICFIKSVSCIFL